MPELSPELGSFPPVRLMLVDLDPIFRLGLKTCLDNSPEFEVVAELGRSSEILQRLETLRAEQLTISAVSPNERGAELESPIDLLVWSVDVRHAGQPITAGVTQLVRSRYPDLPLCVLLGQNDSWLLEELWQGAVDGCWLKDANQTALLAAMRQIASGQKVWDARLLHQISPQGGIGATREVESDLGRVMNQVRRALGNRSLRELEGGLADLDELLVGAGLGVWERLVLEGRFREMQMARRFVQSVILPSGQGIGQDGRSSGRQSGESRPPLWPTQRETERQSAVTESVRLDVSSRAMPPSTALVESMSPPLPVGATKGEVLDLQAPQNVVVTENQFHSYKSAVIESVIAKLSKGMQNLTSEPLEIDILSATKRQELFFIILRLIEETLDDLRFSQVSPVQLKQQRSQILRELWQRATADFFGKYAMLPILGDEQAEVQLVPMLLDDVETVDASILSKIAMVESWMEHLLFQSPLQVESQVAILGSPEAMRQTEALLENLMVRLANAVVAPLLNHFGSSEVVKQNFYDRRWISTREIERFRNALSWKYRMEQFFGEPKNIFESQVPVLILSEMGIRRQELYAPRDLELQDLKGIPLIVTLALEARDAVAPPLRASFTWVGRGVVYVLTQVVGRGIGLIGRGILQGVGTAWQDTRKGQRSSRGDD